MLIVKNTNGIYRKRPNSVGDILQESEDIFNKLSLEEQVNSLMSLMKIFAFENQGIDLKSFGGAKQAGKMVPSKNITERESFVLVNQSVTGLFENQIDLLKV